MGICRTCFARICRYACAIIVALLALFVSGYFYRVVGYLTGEPILVGLGPTSLSQEQLNYFRFNDIPDLTGTVSLVTGANSGVGFYTALHLALHGSNVILGCRNLTKCNEAAEKIRRNSTKIGKVYPEELDLANLPSVEKFSKTVLKQFSRLDIAVFNAGLSATDPGIVDGMPGMFSSNHLGHFKLYLDLQNLIKETSIKYNKTATITHVASGSHYMANTTIYLNSIQNFTETLSTLVLDDKYAFTKLCNVLFSNELAKKFTAKNDNVISNAVHPGGVITGVLDYVREDIAKSYPGIRSTILIYLLNFITDTYCWKTEEGSLTQLFTAVSPKIINTKVTGKYYHPIGIEMTPNPLVNEENQKKLWDFSLELLKSKGFNLNDV